MFGMAAVQREGGNREWRQEDDKLILNNDHSQHKLDRAQPWLNSLDVTGLRFRFQPLNRRWQLFLLRAGLAFIVLTPVDTDDLRSGSATSQPRSHDLAAGIMFGMAAVQSARAPFASPGAAMLALNSRGMSKNDPRLRSVKRCCDEVRRCSTDHRMMQGGTLQVTAQPACFAALHSL